VGDEEGTAERDHDLAGPVLATDIRQCAVNGNWYPCQEASGTRRPVLAAASLLARLPQVVVGARVLEATLGVVERLITFR